MLEKGKNFLNFLINTFDCDLCDQVSNWVFWSSNFKLFILFTYRLLTLFFKVKEVQSDFNNENITVRSQFNNQSEPKNIFLKTFIV